MPDLLSPLFQWLNVHPHLSGFVVFIISAAESVAIIGTIIPGTVMMTAIGTLAGAGVMPLWSTIMWAILGAVVGDGISYWIGHYFQDRLHYIWPFRSYPSLLESGEAFFHKHGGMSVFIGRFVGPVRALVPLVAGMLGMKPLRFTVANVASAIGWAPAYMFPGIVLGAASLELPPDIAVHLILMLLLVSLFIALCLWLIRTLLIMINTQIDQFLNWIWDNLDKSRYFHPVAYMLRHHNKSVKHGQLTLAFYFILTCVAFWYLAAYILLNGSQNLTINSAFFHLFRSLRTPTNDDIMIFITLLGDKKVLLPLIVTLFSWLAWSKRWHTAWHVLGFGILTASSILIIKNIIHSTRPWGIFSSPETFSFPSGHTTLATAFYIAIALLLISACNIKRRWPLYTLIGTIIIAVSASRLYLGAHWFTDVLGGWLLGIAIIILVTLSYNRKAENRISPKGLILTILLTLSVTFSIVGYTSFNQMKLNYAPLDWPTHTLSINAWWQQQGENLPSYRVSRIGMPAELLNLQWLGDLSEIKEILLQQGWQAPPERNWASILYRVMDVKSTEHVPLLSPLYLDKKPVLVLTKKINGEKRLVVLRLWSSNIILKNSKQPLWVGSIGVVPRTYSWLFNHKHKELKLTPVILFAKLPAKYVMKEVPAKEIKHAAFESPTHLKDQNIILIKPVMN